MRVELARFNDRQLNRDLAALCARVNARRPRLPDGRILHLSVVDTRRPILKAQERKVA